MARASMGILLLLLFTPSAVACSWIVPEVGDVQPTEQGLAWKRGEALVLGEPGSERTLATLGPFAGFRAAPDGSSILYARNVGSIGGDCRPEMVVLERWTPEGTQNLTGILAALPLAVHWPTGRGIVANASGASVVDLTSGAVLAHLAPGHSSSGVDYIGHSTSVVSAAWSPTGDKLVVVTADTAWLFRPDGSYLYGAYAGFPLGANGLGMAAFSPDGRTVAVASMQGDRFTTLRTLDVSGDELRFGGAHLDVRGFRAIAWSSGGTLAVAWQEPQVHADQPHGNASVGTYTAALAPIGEHTWEGGTLGGALAWEDSDSLVTVIDQRIVRLDAPIGTTASDPPPERAPVPASGAAGVLAALLAIAPSARRRRAARHR